MIYIGADHRGFELKQTLKKRLEDENLEVIDLGDEILNPEDDYVDYAKKVAIAVAQDEVNRGILLCGSGAGVDIVANKIDGVRCALVFDRQRAAQAREHEDANIIALPADILDENLAYDLVRTFLDTPFSNEDRHKRRIDKIEDLEKIN